MPLLPVFLMRCRVCVYPKIMCPFEMTSPKQREKDKVLSRTMFIQNVLQGGNGRKKKVSRADDEAGKKVCNSFSASRKKRAFLLVACYFSFREEKRKSKRKRGPPVWRMFFVPGEKKFSIFATLE